ncbi:MAG: hypothetical protein M1832_003550 [Thelocarpon impressellum]|nr:MAG: hypothetical protein M1832_003550 [Thelocarpon impressellum]
MATPIQSNLVSSSRSYASSFTQGGLALPPAKGYLLLTCMDARIDPAPAFGIALGDAHVVRNAGGSARDALRSIVISEQLLGTEEVLVVKHTDCGMLTFKNADAHAVVAKNLGDAAADEIKSLDFLPFPTLEGAIKDDIAFLKASKVVPDDVKISGWIYDVKTGTVKEVPA